MKANIKDYLEHKENQYFLKDITGAKVKIDVDKILKRSIHLSKLYNDFLTKNRDVVFTARLDVDSKYTRLYVLDEDDSAVKWLFDIEDLIVVK